MFSQEEAVKDNDDDQSTASLQSEAMGIIRLIIQRPDNGNVLLVRYQATIDEVEPNQESDTYLKECTYWSFKGLSLLPKIGDEGDITEVIARSVYSRLGILITDLERISVLYDRRSGESKIGRLYYLVKEWSGDIPYAFDDEEIMSALPKRTTVDKDNGPKVHLGHFWVPERFLGSYLSHPEVLRANQVWQRWKKTRGGANA
ncbi:MAG: hypothetical protein RLZZ70_11 [Candidatus Parcubacteria bacterium]